MVDCIRMVRFAQHLFEGADLSSKAARILQAVLRARSARLSDIAREMPGRADAGYKQIQRFMRRVDLKAVLLRFFQADAKFVIADPTEIERRQAWKTQYVGKLKDGKTKGFWMLVLATPFRGRAIPFHFITYSSKTIRQEATSRNLNHCRALDGIKALLGDRPLVLDREFSYLELLLNLVAEEVHFAIRLHTGSHPPILLNKARRRVDLVISPGQDVIHEHLLYKGEVPVNVIGHWRHGFSQPLWVMTDLEPHVALELYQQRMKIEETFRDLKSLLGLDKIMNKSQHNLEQTIALLMIAYAIGLFVGEALRDQLFPPPSPGLQPLRTCPRQLYSGLFILLKFKARLAAAVIASAIQHAMQAFLALLPYPVRTHV